MTEPGGKEAFGVVLAAAGAGDRFGMDAGSARKQFMELGGRPVLCYSLEVFASLDDIGAIFVVVQDEELEAAAKMVESWRENCARSDLEVVCTAGGASRQESVRLGIEQVPATFDWILVHDVSRPLVEAGDVVRLMRAVREYGAAALGYPATDSIKQEADGFCERGLDRAHAWCVQTPQGASAEYFRKAYSQVPAGREYTDELGLLEAAGLPARLVEGSRENIKITLPGDDELARFFLSRREGPGEDG